MKRLSGQLVIAALAICGAAQCLAQQYPAKPIRIVIPRPGGGTDAGGTHACAASDGALEAAGDVDSRPGGAGMIGATTWRRARRRLPILPPSPELALNVPLFKKMPYDPCAIFSRDLADSPRCSWRILRCRSGRSKPSRGARQALC
jgi:tripartite-type tricarboxylate transporter receptor subunit TctC